MKFQSTRPRGARRGVYYSNAGTATSFNPRARVGRDLPTIIISNKHVRFNPRARVGRDLIRTSLPTRWSRFNPRARVGRDLVMQRFILAIVSFQSTRPRGARRQ